MGTVQKKELDVVCHLEGGNLNHIKKELTPKKSSPHIFKLCSQLTLLNRCLNDHF